MKSPAPYQLFFPLGLLNALLAIGVWFTDGAGWFTAPAILIHPKLIAGGFLWSFITGFLMTAVPRMAGAKGAGTLECLGAAGLLLALTVFSWSVDPRPFYGSHALLVAFLVVFGARRIARATKPVPVFFSHVAVAMALALGGDFFHFTGDSRMGIHLFHVGAVLLLVLGIGTRFFSFLSGLPSEFESGVKRWERGLFHALPVFVGACLYAAGRGRASGYLGLFLASLVYLFAVWKVQRPAVRPSALRHGMRFVAGTIPLTFLLAWLRPEMFVTWFHLLFIGCFGLITLSVATRVTLAHGAYPTELETKSRALWWMVALLALGAGARVAYGFALDPWWRTGWLHLAASLWLAAVGVWCSSYLLKIFVPGPQSAPSC